MNSTKSPQFAIIENGKVNESIAINLSSNAPVNPQLRLNHVSLQSKIGFQPILQDISVEVEPGDRIALVGISGAGKTSLLRLLNRLDSPSTGEIFFEGENYNKIPVVELRKQITLVFSTPKLLGMTVKDAIGYPLKLRGLSKDEINQRLTQWTERLEIPNEWLNRTEVQLSSGQLQKIAIARALVIQPKILLLDEAITGLDVGNQTKILNILQTLAEDKITLIFATHHLDLIQDWANQLWYLSPGKIVQNTPTRQVDWQALKQQFIDAQKQEAQDWE
ncbi:ABC transporter ATP-binding protein [Capilliphycus salinus ALCB114379]|uniref:ABC transporter ATP-binding protein n=1 Tax=Capilliphycus salinus TaxID=2768948 RepID=UPI0039A65B2E